MKRSNYSLLKMAVTLVVVLGALAGCKKNDNSSSAATPGVTPNWQSCPQCQSQLPNAFPGLVGVLSATPSGDALFAFDILVSQQQGMALDWNNPKAFLMYQGPATLQGVIRIVQPGGMSFCAAPAGDYEVRPLSPSMISQNGIVQGGTFEAVGPAQIVFQVGTSTVYNAQDPNGVWNGSRTNRIGFNLNIQAVGGRPCGLLSTN